MNIGIDPGHGGKDPGAIGPTGLKEKDVNLAIARELALMLTGQGFGVYITRGGDLTMELSQRTNALNDAGVDYVISIHCNAFAGPGPNYISTFIRGCGGEAEKLAWKVQEELVKATGWPDGGVTVKNLHMTRETLAPSILCECGFISNPEQEKQLRTPETRKKLARAIADGVVGYLKGGPQMGQIKVIVKGKEIPGTIISDRTWVPLRELINALNYEVIWDGTDRITIVK
jgi:N-acetylmuramoyl-L-alanine amidase